MSSGSLSQGDLVQTGYLSEEYLLSFLSQDEIRKNQARTTTLLEGGGFLVR